MLRLILTLLFLSLATFATAQEAEPPKEVPASEVTMLKVENGGLKLSRLQVLHGKLAAESANVEYQFKEQQAANAAALDEAATKDGVNPKDYMLDAERKVWKRK